MSLVNFEQPIIGPVPTPPVAISNKGFPYNSLADHRRFEELVYSVAKIKIGRDDFSGYDNVSLMSGVRDKGKDCALFRSGKLHGIIQCKHYAANLSKGAFGEEIVKYVMYSLLEPDLIYDPFDFTYFIAVSNGFVLGCSDFIDDFNTVIITETDLKKWIEYNLNNPTLKSLQLDDVYVNVLALLTKIKVRKIYPQDLDMYLSDPKCIHLISLFFEIRTVTDTTEISKLRSEISGYFTSALNESNIREELQRGSASLRFEKNEFDDIAESHLERKETSALMDWIASPAERNKQGKELNICLLAGNAGMGKTVILKDLYEKLAEENIPALGLKADKIYAANYSELQSKIGISLPVYDFIEQCKQRFTKIVLIIDQLDALSQSMAGDRNYLYIFKSLVDNYLHDESIRIIISVRIFDLHYDPNLRVYKHIKSIVVSPLSPEEIESVLIRLNLRANELPEKLIQLLQTPNHLNVFARIAAAKKANLNITTIQDLYKELWRQKIIKLPQNATVQSKNLKELLYALAIRMFTEQRIAISEHQFEEYHQELSYLESERLIRKEDGQLQFFHQTFYDYIFAKQFVEQNENLIEYIKTQEQSIMIRSVLKMIITYLREYDLRVYSGTVAALFKDDTIYFHFKHMLLSMLAFQEQPTPKETEVVLEVIADSIVLNVLFLEQATADAWMDLMLESKQLDFLLEDKEVPSNNFKDLLASPKELASYRQYYRAYAIAFISKYLEKEHPEAWAFTDRITNPEQLYKILSNLNRWDLPGSFRMFERCPNFAKAEPYWYRATLVNIAKTDPKYAFDQIKDALLSDEYADKDVNKDYYEEPLLKDLAKTIPEKMISTLFTIIERDVDRSNVLGETIIGDYNLTRVDLHDKDHLQGKEYLYSLLAVCLRRAARKEADEFTVFLKEHLQSDHQAILRLIFFALRTNEELFSNEIFELFTYLHACGRLKAGDDFDIEFRELFEAGFPLMSRKQQKEILRTLRVLVNRDEAFVFKGWEKPHRVAKWGSGKYAYLLRLPPDVINNDLILKKDFQQLQRRFGQYTDKSTLGTPMAGMVRRPLSSDAYNKMTVSQWVRSFEKYNKERDPFSGDFLKGGLSEHTWAFRDAAKQEPHEVKFQAIEAIVGKPEYHADYIILGLMGLAEGRADRKRLLILFKQVLHKVDYEKSIRFLITVAKYLLGDDTEDAEIIAFLLNAAKTPLSPSEKKYKEKEETSVNGLIARGMNTIQGDAAMALVYVTDKRFEDDIFNVISTILYEGHDSCKAAVLFRFAYLNHLNRDRAFKLFSETLIREKNIHIVASSLWSLQYMGNYDFSILHPVYEKLVNAKELGRDDIQFLLSLLYFSHLFDKPGAGELLEKFIEINPKSRSWALKEAIDHFYFNETAKEKSHKLIMKVLHVTQNKSEEAPNLNYLPLENIKLNDVYDFLEGMILTDGFVFTSQLINYLTQQCNNYPIEAIKLFHLAVRQKVPEDKESQMWRANEESTKFIVHAFSALKENDKESTEMRKLLLQSFDWVLKDFTHRQNMERILENLI